MGKVKASFMEQREQEFYNDEEGPNELNNHVALSKAVKSLVGLDAATIDTLAKAEIQSVAEGFKDPVDLFTLSTKGLLYFNSINENLKPYVYAQQLAPKGGTYIKNGVELTPSELGVKYDFTRCGDAEWVDLNTQFENAKKAKADREKFLKGIKQKLTVVDEATGEVSTIYEPIKSGIMGYKTSVK